MRILTATAIALALALTGYEGAVAQAPAQDNTPIYGSPLMTPAKARVSTPLRLDRATVRTRRWGS